MKILGIETSCDETALAIVESNGGFERPQFKVIAEALNSQTKIHEKYGGVYPMMAKREHSRNLIPLLKELLDKLGSTPPPTPSSFEEGGLPLPLRQGGVGGGLKKILEREPELLEQFLKFIPTIPKPDIEAIAVTTGPGLEPALWVGINFAKALGFVWDLPVIPTNHMEGHIMSALLPKKSKAESYQLPTVSFSFPALALLISGGHTELVLIEAWKKYKIIGQTRDDAVGEAFDKVARMLDLPYPGGPEISKLADLERCRGLTSADHLQRSNLCNFVLPRPMIKSNDYDFSFSGLKTAVLYTIKKMTDKEKSDPEWKAKMAREFEDSVTEVLITKTKRAIEEFDIKTLIVGGGVIANTHLRRSFQDLIAASPDTQLLIPDSHLSTDNAIMIAMAGYFNYLSDKNPKSDFGANGNLALK